MFWEQAILWNCSEWRTTSPEVEISIWWSPNLKYQFISLQARHNLDGSTQFHETQIYLGIGRDAGRPNGKNKLQDGFLTLTTNIG